MNFGDFLLKENDQYNSILQVIKNLAEFNKRLPMPTHYLDDGQDAVVFDTVDPNVVVRVGKKESGEYTMAEPEIQETGGVAKIYFIDTIHIDNEDWVVGWKEKVDLNVEGYLYQIQKKNQQMVDDIFSVLVGLYHVNRDGIKLLQKYPITKPLADAILAGLPVGDLDVSSNLGVNKKGFIVAYDC